MSAAAGVRYLRRRFSAAAAGYAAAADIQTQIARTLAADLDIPQGACILDVGAGSGVLAQELSRRGAHAVALDAAWGMVVRGREYLPDTCWVQADASALPFRSASFDMVVSSSAYQWVDELAQGFREVRRVLKPGGRFAASLFGRETLEELFVSMEQGARAAGRKLPVLRRLASCDDVRRALDISGIDPFIFDVRKRRVVFSDARSVLSWLKGVGANAAAKEFFWGKELLAQTDKAYRSEFSQGDGVYATFEIIHVEAQV